MPLSWKRRGKTVYIFYFRINDYFTLYGSDHLFCKKYKRVSGLDQKIPIPVDTPFPKYDRQTPGYF